MKLTENTCPKCHGADIREENGKYICHTCGAVFSPSSNSDDNQKEKMKDIANLRNRLNTLIQSKRPYIDEIISITDDILRVDPKDVLAGFYYAFFLRKSRPEDYQKFLLRLCNENLEGYQKKKIYAFMLDSCEARYKDEVIAVLKAQNDFDSESEKRIREALKKESEDVDRYADVRRDVFISYSSKNLEKVKTIVDELEKNQGWTCWYSERNNPPNTNNDDYWEKITHAIINCTVFLFVLSGESKVSPDVLKEIDIAKANGKKTTAVMYRIDDSQTNLKINDLFDGIEWIDASRKDMLSTLSKRVKQKLDVTIGEAKKNKSEYTKEEIKGLLITREFDKAYHALKDMIVSDPDDRELLEMYLDSILQGNERINDEAIYVHKQLLSLLSGYRDAYERSRIEKKYAFLDDLCTITLNYKVKGMDPQVFYIRKGMPVRIPGEYNRFTDHKEIDFWKDEYGKRYAFGNNDKSVVQSDMTLTPEWKKQVFTIIFKGAEQERTYLAYGKVIPEPVLKRNDNRKIVGWADQKGRRYKKSRIADENLVFSPIYRSHAAVSSVIFAILILALSVANAVTFTKNNLFTAIASCLLVFFSLISLSILTGRDTKFENEINPSERNSYYASYNGVKRAGLIHLVSLLPSIAAVVLSFMRNQASETGFAIVICILFAIVPIHLSLLFSKRDEYSSLFLGDVPHVDIWMLQLIIFKYLISYSAICFVIYHLLPTYSGISIALLCVLGIVGVFSFIYGIRHLVSNDNSMVLSLVLSFLLLASIPTLLAIFTGSIIFWIVLAVFLVITIIPVIGIEIYQHR